MAAPSLSWHRSGLQRASQCAASYRTVPHCLHMYRPASALRNVSPASGDRTWQLLPAASPASPGSTLALSPPPSTHARPHTSVRGSSCVCLNLRLHSRLQAWEGLQQRSQVPVPSSISLPNICVLGGVARVRCQGRVQGDRIELFLALPLSIKRLCIRPLTKPRVTIWVAA